MLMHTGCHTNWIALGMVQVLSPYVCYDATITLLYQL